MSTKAESPNKVLESIKWILVVALALAAIVGNYYYSEHSLLTRVLVLLVVFGVAGGIALTTESGRAFNRLRKEAWVEVRKVVWPSRQETIQTTLIVMGVVVVVALILLLVDSLLRMGIALVIGS